MCNLIRLELFLFSPWFRGLIFSLVSGPRARRRCGSGPASEPGRGSGPASEPGRGSRPASASSVLLSPGACPREAPKRAKDQDDGQNPECYQPKTRRVSQNGRGDTQTQPKKHSKSLKGPNQSATLPFGARKLSNDKSKNNDTRNKMHTAIYRDMVIRAGAAVQRRGKKSRNRAEESHENEAGEPRQRQALKRAGLRAAFGNRAFEPEELR